MAGTRRSIDEFFAVKADVVDCIPEAERRPDPCRMDEDGIDIHQASSGAYKRVRIPLDFSLGEFAFSISRETAERYLPNLYRTVSSSR